MRVFKKSYLELIELANTAFYDKEWDSSIKYYETILKNYLDQSPPEVFHRLSCAYRMKEDLLKAEKIAIEGLNTYPTDVQLQAERAEIYTSLGNHLEALKIWENICKEHKDIAPDKAWLKRARIELHMAPDSDKPIKTLHEGLQVHRSSTNLSSMLIKILYSRSNWQNIIEVYNEATSELSIDILLLVIRSYIKLEEYKKALKITEKARTIYVKNLDLLVEHARIMTMLKNYNQSYSTWTEVADSLEKNLNQADVDLLTETRSNISILKRLINIEDYKMYITKYQTEKKALSPKIAIVTAFSKGYDQLKPHEILDSRIEYIAYVEEKVSSLGIYSIKELPHKKLDPARSIRSVKMQPHKLFKKYDYVFWLDASIMVVGDLMPTIESFIDSGLAVGSSVHSIRKSVYEEFDACIALGKDNPELITKQRLFYQKEGYEGNELSENGFLAFSIRHPDLAKGMDTWWEQILEFSSRDQLSFNYALSKHDIEWFRLTKPPMGLRTHPSLVILGHIEQNQLLSDLINKTLV